MTAASDPPAEPAGREPGAGLSPAQAEAAAGGFRESDGQYRRLRHPADPVDHLPADVRAVAALALRPDQPQDARHHLPLGRQLAGACAVHPGRASAAAARRTTDRTNHPQRDHSYTAARQVLPPVPGRRACRNPGTWLCGRRGR